MPRSLLNFIAAVALTLAACVQQPESAQTQTPDAPPLVLTGEITRADHQTYREIPFTVPPGTQRITLDFSYTGKENRTVIDIGVRDPEGQRGWSGGNKSHIEIAESFATPSYQPGPIQPGEWKLVLGIPNIRDGQTASYTATIVFTNVKPDPAPEAEDRVYWSDPKLSPTADWLRGDFHTHTAHSDGSCGPEAARIPCPTLKTVDAAKAANLDFVAITDHNTMSQFPDIENLQTLDLALLLIPGTEITTFNGHANVVGNTDFLDFQLGSPRLPTLAKLFDQVEAQGAFISINHPSLPSGEACMGCGWTVKDTDWSRVTAIEVINGASMRTSGPEGAFNGITFWDKLLREGHRITAIAGSDNHDATDTTGAKQSPVGTPATVVYAKQLSTAGIIAGVKSGRVFIDVAGLPDATLDMRAEADGQTAVMGGTLQLGVRKGASLYVTTTNLPPDATVELVTGGDGTDIIKLWNAPSYMVGIANGVASGWVRANVRDADGKLLLLGNPIYLVRAG